MFSPGWRKLQISVGYEGCLVDSTVTRQKSLNPRPFLVKSTMFEISHNYYGGCLWHACAFAFIQNGRTEYYSIFFYFHIQKYGKNCSFLAGVQLTARGLGACAVAGAWTCGCRPQSTESTYIELYSKFFTFFHRFRTIKWESRDVQTNNFWPFTKPCKEKLNFFLLAEYNRVIKLNYTIRTSCTQFFRCSNQNVAISV